MGVDGSRGRWASIASARQTGRGCRRTSGSGSPRWRAREKLWRGRRPSDERVWLVSREEQWKRNRGCGERRMIRKGYDTWCPQDGESNFREFVDLLFF